MAETAHTGSYGGPTSSSSGTGDGVREQAQEKAQEVKDQAKSQISTQVDQRSTQAGEKVNQQASDIRSVGEQLRSQGKDGPAKVAHQVADRIESVGGWLTRSDGDRILHDIEDFGRRQPWAVMAGGLALGFLASRVLKASSRDRYESAYGAGARGQLPARTRPTYGTPSTGGLEYGTGVGTTGTYGTGTSGYATGEERFARPGTAAPDASDELRPPAGPGGI